MARRVIAVEVTSSLDTCQPLATHVMSESEADEVARAFNALSDPVRLRIFSLIASGAEVYSCNLEAPVAKTQPAVSHHTRIPATCQTEGRDDLVRATVS